MAQKNSSAAASTSTSTSSSSSKHSSISGETDENETILDWIDFKSQSSKKTLHKHFMSPTISATTKASIPRKKILSDKNETPYDIPPQNSLNLEDGDTFYTERPSIRSVLANYCSSESDGDEHHTFASKPYDPLTNYLSPRPKYLRYNPNRRRKIFDLEESGEEKMDNSRLPPVSHFASQKVVDEKDLLEGSGDSVISLAQEQVSKVEDDASLPPVSSFVSQNVVDEDESMEGNSKAIKPDTLVVFPAQGGIAKSGDQKHLGKVDDEGDNDDGSAKQENRDLLGMVEDDCDDDDQEGKEENQEEEEFEEERRCSLKGIVKFMLLLIAIAFFSTSYMSPMTNVGLQVQENSLGNFSLNVEQEAQMDFMNMNWGSSFSEFRGGHRVLQDVDEGVEMTDEIAQTLQPPNTWKKHTYDPTNGLSNKLSNAKSVEIKKLDSDQADLKGEVKSAENDMTEISSETFQDLEKGYGILQLGIVVKNEPLDSKIPRLVHDDFLEDKNEPLDSERIVEQDMHFGKGSPSEKENAADLIDDINELLEIYQNKQDGEVVVQQKGEETVDSGPIEVINKNMEEPGFSSQEPTTESVQDETSMSTLMHNSSGINKNMEEPGFSSQEPTTESVQDETSMSTLMHNSSGKAGSLEDAGESIEDSQETKADNLHHGSYQSALMENNFIGCDEKSTEANVSILGGIAPAYIVVSLLVLALSFLVYMYAPVKRSKQVTVPLEDSGKIFKSNQASRSVDIKHMLLKPPTAHFLSQEAVQENSYIQAPNVEFLGELVIDEVYSSHRRRSGYKHDKTTIDSNHVERSTKASFVDVIDEVYSSHRSGYKHDKAIDNNHMEKKTTKGSFVDVIDEVYSSHRSGYKHDSAIDSNHVEKRTKGSYDVDVLPSCSIASSYSSIEEISTAESPSYGSFTAGKKISKKQGSRDMTLATPVRRSSRIRNLKFTSP